MTALCRKCGEEQPPEAFYLDARGRRRFPCKACMKRDATRWQKEHPERARETQRRTQAKNKHRYQEHYRQYRIAKRDELAQKTMAWRAANRERHRAYSRQWALENPERTRSNARESQRRRRVGRNRLAIGFADILRRDPCSYCGGSAGHIDHIQAVAQGGQSDWANLTSACVSCNSSKSDESLLLFMGRHHACSR